MLIPRFTLRTGLIALTAVSLVSIVLREAYIGHNWARGVVGSMAALVVLLLLHALLYGLARLLSRGARPLEAHSRRGRSRGGTQ